jgi:hypothetical protein
VGGCYSTLWWSTARRPPPSHQQPARIYSILPQVCLYVTVSAFPQSAFRWVPWGCTGKPRGAAVSLVVASWRCSPGTNGMPKAAGHITAKRQTHQSSRYCGVLHQSQQQRQKVGRPPFEPATSLHTGAPCLPLPVCRGSHFRGSSTLGCRRSGGVCSWRGIMTYMPLVFDQGSGKRAGSQLCAIAASPTACRAHHRLRYEYVVRMVCLGSLCIGMGVF